MESNVVSGEYLFIFINVIFIFIFVDGAFFFFFLYNIISNFYVSWLLMQYLLRLYFYVNERFSDVFDFYLFYFFYFLLAFVLLCVNKTIILYMCKVLEGTRKLIFMVKMCEKPISDYNWYFVDLFCCLEGYCV